MSLALIVINRSVWRRLYRLADERFSLNRSGTRAERSGVPLDQPSVARPD
jgi:hypothetical protein